MHKVLVLGVSGMLGSMVFDYLRKNQDIEVLGTARNIDDLPFTENIISFDASENPKERLNNLFLQTLPDYVINCIGIIKPWCKDTDPVGTLNAINVNAGFPYILSDVAFQQNPQARILQIATDCVYDGTKGFYSENDLHNALDVYGKTKSLGEVRKDNFLNIRCSIVGPEIKNKVSLLEWFLSYRDGARVNGFTHHTWNGVTTLQFAQLMEQIIVNNRFDQLRTKNHVIHYVINESVNKYELLNIFNEVFDRKIQIESTDAIGEPVYRTLSSVFLDNPLKKMESAIEELYNYIKESEIYHA